MNIHYRKADLSRPVLSRSFDVKKANYFLILNTNTTEN